LASFKGKRQENQRVVIVKKFAPHEGKTGRRRIQNLKSKGYENCRTEHIIMMEFLSNIPRETTKMTCSRFRPRLEMLLKVISFAKCKSFINLLLF
jgi:hypothetical protein